MSAITGRYELESLGIEIEIEDINHDYFAGDWDFINIIKDEYRTFTPDEMQKLSDWMIVVLKDIRENYDNRGRKVK